MRPLPDPIVEAHLPVPSLRSWGARSKALVVAGIDAGIMTKEEACRRYAISEEELVSWQMRMIWRGIMGLHLRRVQEWRRQRCNERNPKRSPTTRTLLPVPAANGVE